MTDETNRQSGPRRKGMLFFIALLAVIVGVMILVQQLIVKRFRGYTPEPVHERTAAMTERPLSGKPDAIVSPLKIERERHEK